MTYHPETLIRHTQPLILFDGLCRFSGFGVSLLIPKDRRQIFQLAALQSPKGQAILRCYGLGCADLLIDQHQIFARSSACIRIALRLPWPWKLGAVLLFLPRPVGDGAYDLVGRYR